MFSGLCMSNVQCGSLKGSSKVVQGTLDMYISILKEFSGPFFRQIHMR